MTGADTTDLPRRCGRYVLFERLGGGGMAEVYKARIAQSTGPERILVIKLLPMACGQAEAARFLEEAKIALPLTHGNITATFEFDRHEGRPFLVMEYVHGRSLRQILAQSTKLGRQVGMAEALFVCREVARALRYAHNFVGVDGQRSPIVHRDVSPENILVSYSGQVKLTDFGIARSVQALDEMGAWGKPAYVAPEILGGNPGGTRSDVYSVACVLYEVLAGWPPLLGSSEAETLERVRSVVPEPLTSYRDDLPEGLSELVDKALLKDPGRRSLDASEIEVGLSRLLGNAAPHFTETELATSVVRLFEDELRQEAGQADSDLAARIRAQLDDVGLATSGSETAEEMLAMGTVALGDAGVELEPAMPAPPPAGPSGRSVADAKAMIQARDVARDAQIDLSEKSRAVDLGEPSAGGALLATAFGLGALIIGGIVAFVIYGGPSSNGQRGPDGAAAVTAADVGARPPALDGGTGGATGDAGVALPDGTPRRRDAGKRPPRRRWGTVTFNSAPWSYVYVDGTKLPGHTPIRGHKLRAGRHRVRFVNPELRRSKSTAVRVAPGEDRFVKVTLNPPAKAQE